MTSIASSAYIVYSDTQDGRRYVTEGQDWSANKAEARRFDTLPHAVMTAAYMDGRLMGMATLSATPVAGVPSLDVMAAARDYNAMRSIKRFYS